MPSKTKAKPRSKRLTRASLRFKKGDPVWWTYRGTRGYGHVAGVVSIGTTQANTRYRVTPAAHHVSASGSTEGNPIHTGANLHHTSEAAVQADAKRVRAETK